jgi:signal peptidase I
MKIQSESNESIEPTEPKKMKIHTDKNEANSTLSFIGVVVSAFVLALILTNFVFQKFDVVGSSMYPTVHDKDIILVNKLPVTKSKLSNKTYIPQRGDIIVFESPLSYGSSKEKSLIKRVIALPGEKVSLKSGKITVYNDEHPNGFDPDSAYKENLPYTDGDIDSLTVPEGHIFVSGDNRTSGESLDSRNSLGTVPLKNIIGEAWLRIYPFSDSKNFYKN